MDSRIPAAVSRGSGLVTAATLRALGLDPRLVARLVRSGELVAIRRGVYTTGELWDSWNEWRDRPAARIRAAHLTMSVPHVFSHDSAAVLQDVPLIDVRRSEVHVTRRGVVGSQTRYGVRHHGAPYCLEEVVTVGELEVLAVPRTVADVARTHGYEAGLVAADGAMRLGHTRESLLRATEPMRNWPGITVCRAVVTDADAGAETAAETLGRNLVKELGIGDVETQFPVRTTSGVRWCDLRVGCHLFEVDGRVKITPVQRGGVATVSAEHVLWLEKKREREVTSRRLGMSRIVWQDYWEPHRTRARERLLAEFAATCQRHGARLPAELAEDAARLPAQHRRPTG